MGQEIVAHEETHENPIINDAVKVVLERQIGHCQFLFQVLAEYVQANKNELTFLAKHNFFDILTGFGTHAIFHFVANLTADVAGPWLIRFEFFPDDGEIGLVSCESQHDQVSVSSTENVLSVGVMIWLGCRGKKGEFKLFNIGTKLLLHQTADEQVM